MVCPHCGSERVESNCLLRFSVLKFAELADVRAAQPTPTASFPEVRNDTDTSLESVGARPRWGTLQWRPHTPSFVPEDSQAGHATSVTGDFL